jgi:hypothetical protein
VQIAVLGTGAVGQAVGSKLVEIGHDVKMGSRAAGNEKAVAWAEQYDERASEGSFADAVAHGELIINATAGTGSLDALQAAGADKLDGKVLLDVSNPLDFSAGFPPRLAVPSGDSVGEQIQREFPGARVVKVLNTVTAAVMVDPGQLPGEHNIFVAGEDDDAKRQTADLLQAFGWPLESVVDLGGIVASRGLEAYLLFWLALMQSQGSPVFNIKVVR